MKHELLGIQILFDEYFKEISKLYTILDIKIVADSVLKFPEFTIVFDNTLEKKSLGKMEVSECQFEFTLTKDIIKITEEIEGIGIKILEKNMNDSTPYIIFKDPAGMYVKICYSAVSQVALLRIPSNINLNDIDEFYQLLDFECLDGVVHLREEIVVSYFSKKEMVPIMTDGFELIFFTDTETTVIKEKLGNIKTIEIKDREFFGLIINDPSDFSVLIGCPDAKNFFPKLEQITCRESLLQQVFNKLVKKD